MNFIIVKENNCPLYKVGEGLKLSDRTFACPPGKEVCLILARDMTELLFTLRKKTEGDDGNPVFNCSGCSGLIKFQRAAEHQPEQPGNDAHTNLKLKQQMSSLQLPAEFSCTLFELLTDSERDMLFPHFQEIRLQPDSVLIRKGDKNFNLYIVQAGRLQVEDGGVLLARLTPGEICGEMSYLGADEAVSSVTAEEHTTVLAIAGDLFGQLLGNNSIVQNHMAKLLAKRLRRTNDARAGDFAACMSGRLEQIVPAELLQVFHMHQKTGLLTMDFPKGQAQVSFREGCIINAKCGEEENQEAIFAILGEKKGRYRFTSGLAPKEMKAAEIGDFMMLLMEGVKRVDEESN